MAYNGDPKDLHFLQKYNSNILEPRQTLTALAKLVHKANEKWWVDLKTGQRIERNFGELIALKHSELSEALEGHRKGLKDDKLPQYDNYAVELVDCLIRLLDTFGAYDIPLDEIFEAKMKYNAERADHKIENRLKVGGKKY